MIRNQCPGNLRAIPGPDRTLTLVANSAPAASPLTVDGLVTDWAIAAATEGEIDSWQNTVAQEGFTKGQIPSLSNRSLLAIIFRQPNRHDRDDHAIPAT
jgi:hypothetical protein